MKGLMVLHEIEECEIFYTVLLHYPKPFFSMFKLLMNSIHHLLVCNTSSGVMGLELVEYT